MSNVRVRFAPSPTGLLHIGGARTALFNWLYARHTGGTFVLRIEDTDAARNTEAAVQIIFEGLSWLGLDWDEGPGKEGACGPYFQSQRRAIYDRAVERLLSEGKAYERDGAIRFRMPREVCAMQDLICGEVRVDPNELLQGAVKRALDKNPAALPEDRWELLDLVIRRADGSPVFHLVNVVDDLEMGITHVIRGEDHLSNTPKHIALFKALGAEVPLYAHIPLILNPNGSKMSKRDEGASIGEYIQQGYVPEALRNFLCLLGWSPKDNREIVPMEEVIAKFDLPQINRANARFDLNKLFWMNGEYMRAMPMEPYAVFTRKILASHGLEDAIQQGGDTYFRAALGCVQEKIKLGRELADWLRPFFVEDYPIEPEAKTKHLETPAAKEILPRLHDAFSAVNSFDAATLEATLKECATSLNVKTAALVHPCRVAVSGRTVGPSLYGMLEVLGRERVLARLRRAVS
jgi:glutamyl-tRNA synthetase